MQSRIAYLRHLKVAVCNILFLFLGLVITSRDSQIHAQSLPECSRINNSPSIDYGPSLTTNNPSYDRSPTVAEPVCNSSYEENCDCSTRSGYAFFGYDSWRGISDGTWSNNGLHAGLNYGGQLGQFGAEHDIGWQVGGWAGIYNFSGTDYHADRLENTTNQGFFTYGLFHRANECSPWSWGIVNDWMFSDNFSVLASDPTLSQLRGQIGYALNDQNEVGFWGAVRTKESTRDVPVFGTNHWRTVNQLNAYWDHHWKYGTESMIWFGVPDSDRITGDGSLGDYIAGASAMTPLNDRMALYSMVSYMHPSASAGDPGAKEDSWAFVIGVAFYPHAYFTGKPATSNRWNPLMPVANNGYFFIDSENTF